MGQIENDCIVLLKYLSDNPDCDQSYWALSDETGIEAKRLFLLIYFPWIKEDCAFDDAWLLEHYAKKYGYDIQVVFGHRGKHILVMKKDV